uniref:XK-related protein n=1 Tax=Astyanax mexicanus TaxID=7994 RepID=A0A8B9J649_ASTMX
MLKNKNNNINFGITEIPQSTVGCGENGSVVLVSNHSRATPPLSVVLATVLYCAEFICAAVLCASYHNNGDKIWMGLTITFVLVPSVLTQLTLTFIHRDLGRDRPLVLFMHLLQMGPIIRLVVVMGSLFSNCQPQCLITVAFAKTCPHMNVDYKKPESGFLPEWLIVALMVISLISITYGALVCSVLAIQIRYDDYKVRMKSGAYLCMVMWRGLEITVRIASLVLFSTTLTFWVIPVGLGNLLIFFFQPWVEFWARRASLPENVEKNFSKLGTTVVLCMVTLLYACINIFCWSAVQLNLADHDLIEKQPRWSRLAVYYTLRFVENVVLMMMWYVFQSDFYTYICVPLLVVQLIVCYGLAVVFMLLFHQFCHPARKLFKHNVEDCLRCACCCRKDRSLSQSQSQSQEDGVLVTEDAPPPDLTSQLGDRETDILEDTMEAA